MKEFNLELAKKEHPVQTRDGRKVRIICYDKKDKNYPIVALVEDSNYGTEDIEEYTIDGKFDIQILRSDKDLFMAPVTKEGWVNIYRKEYNPVAYKADFIWNSKEDAINNINPAIGTYITTKKIEWEE